MLGGVSTGCSALLGIHDPVIEAREEVSREGGSSASSGEGGAGVDGEAGAEAYVDEYPALRNKNPLFRGHRTDPQATLASLGLGSDDFAQPSDQADQGPGPGGQGHFIVACQYSHFGTYDPARFPGRQDLMLSMFWGNTDTSPTSDPGRLLEVGGGTCQGFELDRSAYWMPALLDRSTGTTRVVLPRVMFLEVKSYRPKEVHPFPIGLTLVAGSLQSDLTSAPTFTASPDLSWSCGEAAAGEGGTIPRTCSSGDDIRAAIYFPECLAVDGEGRPLLRSADQRSHATPVEIDQPCPTTHPYRIPRLGLLVYFPNGTDGAGAGVSEWRLASDTTSPGGSLFGGWMSAWNADTVQAWTDGCFDPKGTFSGPRVCTQGETGSNGRLRTLRRVSPLNDFTGTKFLPL